MKPSIERIVKNAPIARTHDMINPESLSAIPAQHSAGWERPSNTSMRMVLNMLDPGYERLTSLNVSSGKGAPLQKLWDLFIQEGWEIFNYEGVSKADIIKSSAGVDLPIFELDELCMVHREMKAVCEFNINTSHSDVECQKQGIEKREHNAFSFKGKLCWTIDFYVSENTDSEMLRDMQVKVSEMFNLYQPMMGQREKSTVGMIAHNSREYCVKEFSIKNVVMQEDRMLDAHYGYGFAEWSKGLLSRMQSQKNGLVLMHGEPGTGKTQFIRQLLNSMIKLNKAVLYVPPSFSAQLLNPDMLNFITDWVHEQADEEGKDCVLLIEDAEPLLEIRHGADGRTTGISNLLNMTDGLLGDILGLTVMATFNTQLSKIDPALLRPQRLIARKEFGKMNDYAAEELAKMLNLTIPEDLVFPATLAEFYASATSNESLTHAINVQHNKIGFR